MMTAVTEVLVIRQHTMSTDHMRSQCDTATYTSHCSTGASCQILNFGGNNVKRAVPNLATIEYGDTETVYGPEDFPDPTMPTVVSTIRAPIQPTIATRTTVNVTERARRYLAAMPPAIAGQHGDVHTFRVCCRLVRGFALSDADAMALLGEWNARCEPPWAERELRDKLQRARRYGHEPVGGLLDGAGGRLGPAPT